MLSLINPVRPKTGRSIFDIPEQKLQKFTFFFFQSLCLSSILNDLLACKEQKRGGGNVSFYSNHERYSLENSIKRVIFFPYYPSLDITGKTEQCASVCGSIFIRYAFQVRCAQKKLIVVLT